MSLNEGILERKAEHVRLTLEVDPTVRNVWDDLQLVHYALSEENFETVRTTVLFDQIEVRYPIVCVGMTGGYPGAHQINENLAHVAAEFQIPMGVGSQRVMLEHPDQAKSFAVLKDYSVPVRIANIGMTHIGNNTVRYPEISRIMETIDANFIGIHLNVLQELCQREGHLEIDRGLEKLRALSRDLPVLIKETGAGISRSVARELVLTSIRGIDTSGYGGTNFAMIENRRKEHTTVHWTEEWGIPAPISIIEARSCFDRLIIGSGGIRHGLDIAKALALGADFAGIGGILLRAASQSYQQTEETLRSMIQDLQRVMILTGSRTLVELRNTRRVFHRELRDWI